VSTSLLLVSCCCYCSVQRVCQDNSFYTVQEFCDWKKPKNKLRTDKQRKALLAKWKINIQQDETGVDGVYVKAGPKVIRTGKRMDASLIRRQAHDDKSDGVSAVAKHAKGLKVKALTQDQGFMIQQFYITFCLRFVCVCACVCFVGSSLFILLV
jgi:hypothetical protein